jgi:hypothetical protein
MLHERQVQDEVTNQFAIAAVIQNRCAALRLGRSDLVRRAGYKNIAKGIRRLDALCAGDLNTTASLIAGLPAALELPPEEVAAAVRQIQEQITAADRAAEEAREAVWRANFSPCAYLRGAATRPSSGFMYGISGGPERWLKIPLDLSRSPLSFAAQALEDVRNRREVQFFGPVTGFVINYTLSFAVGFDVQGNALEFYHFALRGEEVPLAVGKKPIPPGLLSKMIYPGA